VAESVNPYAAPKAALEDAPLPPQVELATRAARLGAAVTDTVVVFAFGAFGAIMHPSALWLGLGTVAAINLWTLHRHRASLGKMALKLRIVRRDGSEVELWRIVALRWLPTAVIGFVPGLNLLNLIDALFIFREDRRCVHDMVADTVVVDA